MRKAGVLMPLASLPSDFGVGDLGKKSYEFVDILKRTGMRVWQLLPLNPVGYGNSPYQPYSSFAGDEIYIDLYDLKDMGLLDELKPFHAMDEAIDFEKVRKYKREYLKKAFSVFSSEECKIEQGKEYQTFADQQWVQTYAVFLTLKEQNSLKCWNEWPKDQQDWILNKKYNLKPLQKDISFHLFIQFLFYKQWMKLKQYANKQNILIMGDIPFYVGIDSADVWADRSNFLLDKKAQPSFIAGVPPDFFSTTGQRWGNPIYDWDYMKKDGYTFWMKRLEYSSRIYDILRIDHFRAFDTYWKIPASCPTAIDGEWIEAPGYDFFDTLFKNYKDMKIVVEDLGDLRPEVLELRDHYRFKGMNIAQFTILGSKMPKLRKNELIYTGTHDNQTIKGWYQDLPESMKRKAALRMKPYGKPGELVTTKLLRYVFKGPAEYAIVPVQDLLGLSDEARLNTPGTVGSPNWEWRMPNLQPLKRKVAFITEMLKEADRT